MPLFRAAIFTLLALQGLQAGAGDAVLPEDTREQVLALRRTYATARGDTAEQAAVVAQAIELGPLGVSQLKPLVQQDAMKAVEAYLARFSRAARKLGNEDAAAIVAGEAHLPSMRDKALHLGQLWSQLDAAAGLPSFDPEEQLEAREQQIFRLYKLGPIFSQLGDEEIEAIDETNARRVEHDLPPLTVDLQLCLTARDHSKDMATIGFFSHESPVANKTTFADRARRFNAAAHGENIFAGNSSGNAAVEAWMNSEGHRANILDASYRRIGIGLHGKHWTQVFGR